MEMTKELAQCDECKHVLPWDDVEYVNDPWCSDGTITVCPECRSGESFNTYKGETK